MLKPLTAETARPYIGGAYLLALDRARSGYPAYTDEIKTEADFIKAVENAATDKNSELLLFEHAGKASGLLGYFALPDDNYVQVSILAVENNTAQALSELIDRLATKFRGYELYIGITESNKAARDFLERHGFECIEHDHDHSFFFDGYSPLAESADVQAVTRQNFSDFKTLHDGEQMYWTSDRIFADLDNWNIYVRYGANGSPVGAIYTRGKETPEIFGVDLAEAFDPTVYKDLLISLLDKCKASGAKHMTYFTSDTERPIAQELGFIYVGEYFCYMKVL